MLLDKKTILSNYTHLCDKILHKNRKGEYYYFEWSIFHIVGVSCYIDFYH